MKSPEKVVARSRIHEFGNYTAVVCIIESINHDL